MCRFSRRNKCDFYHHTNIYPTTGFHSRTEKKGEAAELPFDKEHELSLSVCGADDAFRLEVIAEVGWGVRLLVAVWLKEDAAVALQGADLLLRLQT